MTAANSAANGASLEDCHTNLFALTDLSGIKWRKFSYDCPQEPLGPLEDPVLVSYSRCIAANILSVWRRVPFMNTDLLLSLDVSMKPDPIWTKELWIYWYGDDPNLEEKISPDLKEVDEGTWDNGLSYECRTLLFKSLHNLIERCLLSHNYVHLGKWFVRPYDSLPASPDSFNDHLSFAFSFFLHGESTVCANVEVSLHQPVCRLSLDHLALAQGSASGFQVILTPYGLSGVLTGQSYKANHSVSRRILNEWRHFYPIKFLGEQEEGRDTPPDEEGQEEGLPAVVDVLVAGVRMLYPTAYVLVPQSEEMAHVPIAPMPGTTYLPPPPVQNAGARIHGITAAAMSSISLTPPTSPPDQPIPGEAKITMVSSGMYPNNSPQDPGAMYAAESSDLSPQTLVGRVACRMWRELTVPADTPQQQQQQQQVVAAPPVDQNALPAEDGSTATTATTETRSTATNTTVTWDFNDPSTRANCSCSRQKSLKQKGGMAFSKSHPSSHMSSKHSKSDSKQDRQQRTQRPITPFHHRSVTCEDILALEQEAVNQRLAAQNAVTSLPAAAAANGAQPQATQHDGKLSQGKFTQPSPAAFRPGGPSDSVLTESPPSVVPSPLVPPPVSASSANERTMPALSPYPPARSGSDSGTPTTTNAPAGFSRSDTTPTNHDHPDGLPIPPMMGGSQMMDIPRGMEAHMMAEHQKEEREEDPLWQCFKLPNGFDYKRPLLPAQCYELDDADGGGWDALYDLDNNIEVFSQPQKKLKPERPLLTNQDLLSGNFCVDQLDYKPAHRAVSPEPIDPYEFMEQDPSPTSRVISCRSRGKDVKGKPKGLAPRRNSNRKERKKLEEEAARRAEEEKMKQEQQLAQEQMQTNSVDEKGPLSNQSMGRLDSSSFTQVNDLKVTYEDLDQLFQSSDDDDDGGPFEDKAQGPPSEEAKPPPGTTGPVGGAYNCPTELAVMFPTPPSLEQQNSAFSPLNQPCQEYLNHGSVAGLTQMEQSSLGDISEVEVDDTMGSPKPDSIEDWSYVYKTPTMERFVGASMYAPLKSLPSSKLPPLRIPDNCVYKPSWQIPLSPKPEFIPTTKESATSSGGQLINSPASAALPVGVYPPGSQGPRSVANTDIAPSPASEASSYIKNLNSLESASLGANIPEAHSLMVNVVLSDSQLNLFKDRNFDSCVICACNMTIRGGGGGSSEALQGGGAFDSLGPCSCGFSAVMNRRYGTGSGLFAEDESEITGQFSDVALWACHRDNPMLAAEFARKGPLALEGGLSRLYTKDGVPVGTETLRTSNALLRLIQDQCNTPYSTLCRLNCIAKRRNVNSSGQLARSQLEIEDGCEVCFAALEQGRQVAENSSNAKLDDTLLKNSCLHSWPYTPAGLFRSQLSSQDIVRTLSSLQPLLQDAIQKKRTTRLWERPYTVQGPLTWQVFFNLADKGSSESPEPLPIPPLLVGYDRDWLSSSPYALHNWEKLLLEPYSATRDIAYVALVPDNDFILQCAKSFFREVTAVYESCRLGRHAPIAKTQRDGIFRIGSKYASKVAEEPVDDWFSEIAHLPESSKLKLYAQVCKAYVGPFLSRDPPDHTLFTTSRHDRSASTSSSSTLTNSNLPGGNPSSGGPAHMGGASQGSMGGMGNQGSLGGDGMGTLGGGAGSQQGSMGNMPAPSTTGPSGTGSQQDSSSSDKPEAKENETGINIVEDSDYEKPPSPAVVVYIVDPFSQEDDYGEQSVSSLALLKSFAEIQSHVQGDLKKNLILQIIPLHQILQVANSNMSSRLLSQIKCHAFSVFSQCRRHLLPSVAGQSLTGFGPAAELDRLLRSNKGPKPQYRLYSPPYILTPLKDKQTELGESFGELRQACGELFCGYCLSHDQRLLLVACTDSKGEMMETQVINIDVPNRKRRKKVCVRNIALIKLWDFLMGVMSKSPVPWRLVVGRFGRLGQGELRDWSALLSRRSLTTQSRTLKDMCNMCNVTGNNDYPCILSACLVSMEPEPGLRIMADSVAADKCSKNAQRDQPSCQLHTPDDATCTHIHVFPTSATKQFASGPYQAEPMMDLSFTNPTDNVLPADDDLLFITEGLGNQDLAQILGLGSPTNMNMGSPVPSHSGQSPGGPSSPGGQQMNMAVNSENMNKNTNQQLLPTEPEESLLQQPLAMGFFVSTAKTGPLPDWFWSSCPEAENNCPVFLKAALHLHNASVQQMTDDLLQTKHNHPLDSNLTTDVLRYVLESYNSLSWLTVDPASGDRRSCLPIHLVVLMQLYNTIAALF
ncbi:mediator of RNA polymerase II transcription subunit 13-like isoform X2 [Patiria miniata]|uniref:Mediator of RNA polymerase II transcription subunit 13 n=1 Tax=Patiria miniata TaxID=46514 RepID=A0A914A918_PATMI|nr:mediator of RNA polymerase II transcription subunit 13-like isoform X2 [Patiria miniata]